MLKQTLAAGAAAMMFSLSVCAGNGDVLDSNTGIVTKPSKFTVGETMDRMEAAAKAAGATIFSRIDW